MLKMNLKKSGNRFRILSKHRPFLIVISAPSGCGKTTILQSLIERLDGLSFSVSHTTRKPRAGEISGNDYHFVDLETFHQMQGNGEFVESAIVHSNYYGTSFAGIDKLLKNGLDVILDIDIQGMCRLKESDSFDLVTIFILPPSLNELENRLRNRDTDSDSVILKRIKNAACEIKFARDYDYNVVNNDIELAVDSVASIVKTERLRSSRFIVN